MAKKIRYIMLGGFLGAGKTTTISRLARLYREQGLNVGIVTNDQAADLVDTHMLRSQGYDVGEVAGACFCCNFNELTDTVGRLEETKHPDVILAEPVGSCTDLVATVVLPLQKLFEHKFEVAPYAVILKPNHGRRILEGDGKRGFSPKAEYIFRKQLEEADLLLINRVDELSPEDVDHLESLLKTEQPDVPILRISARNGDGFDELVQHLDQPGQGVRRVLELDYDVYAEGEAELGWLNSSLKISKDEAFSLDQFLTDAVQALRDRLETAGAETAHLKAIGLCEGAYGVANLVGSDVASELSLASHAETKTADVVINARVAIDPETLQELVDDAVKSVTTAHGLNMEPGSTQSFRPGRPVPTHRYPAST
ncbi:GTP-binding protein [Thalassoroseus pseudoceratinae]|uniref:GTP-binding protein n=1 Tax=Thalassoroseus pseudoceratinae TaxID=2713176 RepID=UPI001424405C|nr:GTP-binding protein [Thalassoroseus pseudoceratinae]